MICKRLTSNERPTFPKRAIITAGMPYGNKDLHFGHVGGMFIHDDIFARFLSAICRSLLWNTESRDPAKTAHNSNRSLGFLMVC